MGGTYTFTLRATDSAAPQQTVSTTFTLNVITATVAIDTTTVLTTVPQTFFGLHTSVYDTSLNDTAKLPALLQTTGITTLRYPGGGYSDRYHWAQFSLSPQHASSAPACTQLSPGFLGANADFGNFVKTLAATATQALITVNYGTSVANSTASLTAGTYGVPNRCSEPNAPGQHEEAAAWVAYANGSPSSTQVIGIDAAGFDWKTVGFWASLRAASPLPTDDGYNFLRIARAAPVGIKFWEIGNEVYYNGWSEDVGPEDDIHAPYIYPNGLLRRLPVPRKQPASLPHRLRSERSPLHLRHESRRPHHPHRRRLLLARRDRPHQSRLGSRSRPVRLRQLLHRPCDHSLLSRHL